MKKMMKTYYNPVFNKYLLKISRQEKGVIGCLLYC